MSYDGNNIDCWLRLEWWSNSACDNDGVLGNGTHCKLGSRNNSIKISPTINITHVVHISDLINRGNGLYLTAKNRIVINPKNIPNGMSNQQPNTSSSISCLCVTSRTPNAKMSRRPQRSKNGRVSILESWINRNEAQSGVTAVSGIS